MILSSWGNVLIQWNIVTWLPFFILNKYFGSPPLYRVCTEFNFCGFSLLLYYTNNPLQEMKSISVLFPLPAHLEQTTAWFFHDTLALFVPLYCKKATGWALKNKTLHILCTIGGHLLRYPSSAISDWTWYRSLRHWTEESRVRHYIGYRNKLLSDIQSPTSENS